MQTWCCIKCGLVYDEDNIGYSNPYCCLACTNKGFGGYKKTICLNDKPASERYSKEIKMEKDFIDKHIDELHQNGEDTKSTILKNDSLLIPVLHKDYMFLSDAYDVHSKNLMGIKGEEYSINGDFLAMENRLAGMLGSTPEHVSLVMAGKHVTALGIILEKNDSVKIKLEKLDERVRDAVNLLKIMSAFIHAKQNDFSLHLGKDE